MVDGHETVTGWLPPGYFDDIDFAWPATERTKPKKVPKSPEAKPAKPVIPISASELRDLRAFRRARLLARRWEAEDEDVTLQDVIDALLRHEA